MSLPEAKIKEELTPPSGKQAWVGENMVAWIQDDGNLTVKYKTHLRSGEVCFMINGLEVAK